MDTVDFVVRIAKALASPVRVRAVQALRHRELCLCELAELFGTAPSTMSRHMSVLAGAGLVRSRRDSRWTYYRLPAEPRAHLDRALDLVDVMAAADPAVRRDAARVRTLACR
jgi:ArsR family transcriptional regulator